MTRQLEQARRDVDANQRALEQLNLQLDAVLTNLSAGVLVFDRHFVVLLANPAAARMLRKDLSERNTRAGRDPAAGIVGRELSRFEPFVDIADAIRTAFADLDSSPSGVWQRQFTLTRAGTLVAEGDGDKQLQRKPDRLSEQTLLMRGSRLPGALASGGGADSADAAPDHQAGYVLVFDDISEVISAQRSVAWAEVAQRVAHEIKNPLTPIQLAAERTRMKLIDRLSGSEADLLERNTRTLVDQVQALKLMVDEFRDFARLPSAAMAPLDLNALVTEVAQLYQGNPQQRVHLQLDPRAPLIIGDSKQLRQVFHNLLKNAFEAYESLAPDRQTLPLLVEVVTELIQPGDQAGAPLGSSALKLRVRDHGPGFAPSSLARVFEPYITTKPKGTGLGLAIVKKIVEEHGAVIEVANWSANPAETEISGAQVSVLFTKTAKSVDNTVFPQ